jgi:uncharacterized protein (TIGR01244 family)
MPYFKPLSDLVIASPQLTLADIDAAKEANIITIVNNRPDGEDPSAPQGEEIETRAASLGIGYVAIPIGHSGFSENQIDAFIDLLDRSEGKILAYCRTGTRSTLLWALAQAKLGEDPDAIAKAAMDAGYDVSPVRPMMDMLAAR